MDTLIRRLLIGLGALGLSSCGTELPRIVKSPALQSQQLDRGEFLDGAIRLSEGTSVDLSSLRDRPLVLMIAGEFCATCIHEVGVFKDALKGVDPDELDQKIRFRSVLVANDDFGARLWKKNHSVPWPVGFQEGDALFNQWCPERLTPCLIVQVPERGVVLRKAGRVSVSEIEALTGPWKGNEE